MRKNEEEKWQPTKIIPILLILKTKFFSICFPPGTDRAPMTVPITTGKAKRR